MPTFEPCFTQCTGVIVHEIASAKRAVHVQAYDFTSERIATALISADERGVNVVVIADVARSGRTSKLAYLTEQGIECYTDSAHAQAHNKVMIIDGDEVLTGSFNFTVNAEENNAENLLVIRDKRLADRYEKNWHEHWRHSEYFQPQPRTTSPRPTR